LCRQDKKVTNRVIGVKRTIINAMTRKDRVIKTINKMIMLVGVRKIARK